MLLDVGGLVAGDGPGSDLLIEVALLGAGADPALGSPDARATAAYFQLPVMASLLNRS